MISFAFFNKSIKRRVITLISLLFILVMFVVVLSVVSIVYKGMSYETSISLDNKAAFLHKRIEQRLAYLIENTALLTKNGLIVNALTDAEGRKKYLPPLVENFMLGKDVVSLSIVDFGGQALFKTQDNIPLYNESETLRNALAMGKIDYYVDDKQNQFIVISPIEYYNTTQGAAVVVFNLNKILETNLLTEKNIYFSLLKNGTRIYTNNFFQGHEYQINHHDKCDSTTLFHGLGLSLELGMDSEGYIAPVRDVVFKLIGLSVFFILIGIWLAIYIARSITKPILELHKRVTEASNEQFCSPLGTNDELESLAKAFDKRSIMLQYQAQHDALTLLPNRLLFMDRLQEKIKEAQREKRAFGVLFLDLDHFKEVNDSFGHDFGDELLRVAAENLSSVLRGSDSVARMGGDEFTILLNNVQNADTIVPIAEKIMQIFQKPFTIRHHQFYITCSIGVGLYPINGKSAEELLKNADAAMYKAKDEGRNNYKFYTDSMTVKAYDRIMLETALRKAIINREFEVYYQPQVNMQDESILGMEALVRWNHPEKGIIAPDNFIPLAEETGLIIEIDRQVMHDAVYQFQRWIEDGYKVGVLSINLSMVQLNHEDFLDFLKNLLVESKISTDYVMFEVTETQVMKNPENAIIVLGKLKALGIKLAVDDFGTGHSSLSYLKKLPIDKLKIDQSFTQDVLIDENDAELTRAIISIAKSLRLEIIAEGVETKEQGMFLMENGCMEAQGYFYYKPQSSQTITKILSEKI